MALNTEALGRVYSPEDLAFIRECAADLPHNQLGKLMINGELILPREDEDSLPGNIETQGTYGDGIDPEEAKIIGLHVVGSRHEMTISGDGYYNPQGNGARHYRPDL